MRKKIKLPRYPVYIPSKGRYDNCLTADLFVKHKVPFYLVVEPQEYEDYVKKYGDKSVLKLPFSNRGSVIPTRNWIKEHSTKNGYKRHWQWDDNIKDTYRFYRGKRIKCPAGVSMAVAEDFSDRYENIAITGLEYTMFGFYQAKTSPFQLNIRVYSCSLINNEIPHKWRGSYNEDTDLCLQVLSDGWCTVLINAFMCDKQATMTMGGGNTAVLYQGDGRAKMARSLERLWPGVVETKRRFQRPQHVVKNGWQKFDTPLKRRKDIDWDKIKKEPHDYKMNLNAKAPIKSRKIKELYEQRKQRAD